MRILFCCNRIPNFDPILTPLRFDIQEPYRHRLIKFRRFQSNLIGVINAYHTPYLTAKPIEYQRSRTVLHSITENCAMDWGKERFEVPCEVFRFNVRRFNDHCLDRTELQQGIKRWSYSTLRRLRVNGPVSLIEKSIRKLDENEETRPVPPPRDVLLHRLEFSFRSFTHLQRQCYARIAEIAESNDEDLSNNNNDDNNQDQDQRAPPFPSAAPRQLRRSARIAEKENIPQQLRRSTRIKTNAVVPTPPPPPPPQLVPVQRSLCRNELWQNTAPVL